MINNENTVSARIVSKLCNARVAELVDALDLGSILSDCISSGNTLSTPKCMA